MFNPNLRQAQGWCRQNQEEELGLRHMCSMGLLPYRASATNNNQRRRTSHRKLPKLSCRRLAPYRIGPVGVRIIQNRIKESVRIDWVTDNTQPKNNREVNSDRSKQKSDDRLERTSRDQNVNNYYFVTRMSRHLKTPTRTHCVAR